ncbi:hypothetical protein O3M35_007832 [Rhynocoris fuscipes]|uniref:Uncharacterized protein n=1 Tax=Rhynocoris fuscipes TaxID=488301 RepID=A0AAW1DI14_9HEMI
MVSYLDYDQEKERKKAEQMARIKGEEKTLAAEEKLAEKMKRQKLQEADLCLAKEVFGVIGGVAMEIKEGYDKLREDIL